MVVLDSWALLAFLNDEPSAERIEQEWLANGAAVSAINLGEVLYIRIREHGEISAAADVEMIREQAMVIDPDWQLIGLPRRSRLRAASPTRMPSASPPPNASPSRSGPAAPKLSA